MSDREDLLRELAKGDAATIKDWDEVIEKVDAMDEEEWLIFAKKLQRHLAIHKKVTKEKLHFQSLIEELTLDWKNSPRGFRGLTGQQIYETYIKECHPFTFSTESSTIADLEGENEPQDLPFSTISIESLHGYLTIPKHADVEEGIPATWLKCLVVRETSPGEYDFLLFGELLGQDNVRRQVTLTLKKDDDLEAFNLHNSLLKHFLKKIPKHKVGIISNPFKMKVGTGKGKEFCKPKNLVVISPKPDLLTVEGLGSRQIEWSHRWEVRGHWRTCKGIGKDREGNYNKVGFTWVNNFVKGPENKPIIKKTYLVE